jgi:hypothetical protein
MAQWFREDGAQQNAPYFALEYKKTPRKPPEVLEIVAEAQTVVEAKKLVTVDAAPPDTGKLTKVESTSITNPKNVKINNVPQPQAATNGSLITEYVIYRGNSQFNVSNIKKPHVLTSKPIAQALGEYGGVVGVYGAKYKKVEWTPAVAGVDYEANMKWGPGFFASEIGTYPTDKARQQKERLAGKGAICTFAKGKLAMADPQIAHPNNPNYGQKNHQGDGMNRVVLVDKSGMSKSLVPIQESGTKWLLIRYYTVPVNKTAADGSIVFDKNITFGETVNPNVTVAFDTIKGL